ncbi:hypothetical protein MarSH_468 [Marseillevirus Shanghai 1]|nr:hypothetical protein MarSH_468 [Marseillevirus Shanghai 1]
MDQKEILGFPLLMEKYKESHSKEKEKPLKSAILKLVVKYLKKHTDAEDGDITTEVKVEDAEKKCECKREYYFIDVCRHGRPFSFETISVKVSLKGWNSWSYDKEVIYHWREVQNQGKTRIFPFRFHESYSLDRGLSQILGVVGKTRLVEFRRERSRKLSGKVQILQGDLKSATEKLVSLEQENKKLQNLLAELYAPGGTLAKEAERDFMEKGTFSQ